MTDAEELDQLIADMNRMKRVLIVDDTQAILDVVGAIFEAQGVEVVTALTPEKAIEVYELEDRFNCVVVDLVFPKEETALDGIDIISHIRGKDPVSPPIILLTGYPGHERLKNLGQFKGPVTVLSKDKLGVLSKYLFGRG